MKVHELIDRLKMFPSDYDVHLDVSAVDDEWEGERVVRHIDGLRTQAGFYAVAIDAADESPK